jgi:hypothetical protein
MGTRRRRAAVVVVAMLAGLLAGCSSGANGFAGPAPQPTGPAVTYVSVGEPQSTDLQDVRTAWPQQFYRAALPHWATAYEVAVTPGWQSNTGSLVRQLLALRPTVVTVALGEEEAALGIGVTEFSAALRRVLQALHRAGVPTVLVANLQPLDGPQPGGAGITALIGAYNQAIAAAAPAEGAVLVDVHSALSHALQAGKAAGESGGGLTPLGENLTAAAFELGARHRPLWRQKPSHT